jgi:hypothetical protein
MAMLLIKTEHTGYDKLEYSYVSVDFCGGKGW